MIQVGGRWFVPIKIAAHYVGYSKEWLYSVHAINAKFPQKVSLSVRRKGYWRDELDAWKISQTKRSA